MTTIPQIAEAMQTVLTDTAEQVARETEFVQRESKMGGAAFAQTLTFGWLENPEATLEELCQTAAAIGVVITPQGLDQRFGESAAQCMQKVLEAAVDKVITSDPVAIPILQRFNGVYLDDSSTVTLPDELSGVWQGCGGSTEQGTRAALKLQVRLDYAQGTLRGPFLQDGRTQDRLSPLQQMPVDAGSLRMADLGYWSLGVLEQISAQDGYWLSRAQVQVKVYTPDGKKWDLLALMRSIPDTEIDLPVELGVQHRLPARLLAVRVPQQVADRRRRRLREEARSRGQAVSKTRLALADWTILVTNVPVELLSLREALVLARTRWQIELIFKLWKSHGRIDEWRSKKPWRILCEVYAKLTAMVVQHWLLLVSCWHYPDRSLFKAAKTIRKHATNLVCAFASVQALSDAIKTIQRCLSVGCRINKRKAQPHTYQLLLSLTDGGLA
jgi:hypothetical protein